MVAARPGVFHQLFGYAHQYARKNQPDQPASQLSLFLLVPTVTPTVLNDAALLGLELGPSDNAYIPVKGALFPTWVVPLNTLADEEGEPLIGELGSRTVDPEDHASLRWLAHFYMANEERVQQLEGFEELKADFMKSASFREMVAAMSAEEVAQTLTPEQRNAVMLTMSDKERYAVLLAMSDDALRQLPDSFIEALPESVRSEILQRLAH